MLSCPGIFLHRALSMLVWVQMAVKKMSCKEMGTCNGNWDPHFVDAITHHQTVRLACSFFSGFASFHLIFTCLGTTGMQCYQFYDTGKCMYWGLVCSWKRCTHFCMCIPHQAYILLLFRQNWLLHRNETQCTQATWSWNSFSPRWLAVLSTKWSRVTLEK